MTICFQPLAWDAERQVYTSLPAGAPPDDDAVDVNNANGAELLRTLGLAPEPDGILAIDAFARLVTAALRRHLGRRSPEIAPAIDASPGRITTITGGRREGYLEERLGDLARLVQRGRVVGATHIGWA